MSPGGESSARPTVWIAVHDLSRTGVPIMLVRLLAALSARERSGVHVVALRPGPMATELRRWCGSLTVLEPADRRSWADATAVGLDMLGAARLGRAARSGRWRRVVRGLPSPDVVVAHGAGAWPVAAALQGRAPVVVHLHELATGLDRCIPRADQEAAFGAARQVMAVSGPVADLAVARGAHAERLSVVPGVVDVVSVDRAEPAWDPADAWVMGAGTPGWRKGTDRLAGLAHGLTRAGRAVSVGWVGGSPSGPSAPTAGAVDPVTWFDDTASPWSVMARAQVVVIPSREDPMPLVALEAGARALPVVAMATGGLTELLDNGRGRVVEHQRVDAFIDEVLGVLGRPEDAAAMGERLRGRVRAHHDAASVAPRWWELIVDAAG